MTAGLRPAKGMAFLRMRQNSRKSAGTAGMAEERNIFIMVQKKNSEYMGILLVFLAGALWGIIGFFVTELERAGSTPSMTSFLRVFFAFLLMAVITGAKFGWRTFLVDKKTFLFCALLGLVCHGIYNMFYSLAVTMAGVSVSAVLLNIAPVFTLIFSVICFSEKPTWLKVFAAFVDMAGCILVATNGEFQFAAFSLTGILCGVGAGFCYSMTAVIGKFAAERTNPFVMSTYSYFFAAAFLGLYMRPWSGGMAVINKQILLWGFLYALIPTAFAYLLYYWGLKKITENSKVPVIASVETVVAAAVGILVYREPVGAAGIAGIVMVMLSVVMLSVSGKRNR